MTTEEKKPTFYPGPSRIHLAAFPPKERWDDWTELDSRAWPKRVERRYSLVPTTCFNCESACGQKGGCIWIITNEYKFYQSTQSAPGGNEWWAWSPGDYQESLLGYEITAAGQNNGLAQVWGVSLIQDLHSQVVNKDSKDWEWYWTPPA